MTWRHIEFKIKFGVAIRKFASDNYATEVRLISTIYKAAPGYIHRKIGGTDVLVSVGSGVADFNGYIELNDSASFLWDLLKEGHSIDELSGNLQTKFGIDADTAAVDVEDFLKLLKENKMLVVV